MKNMFQSKPCDHSAGEHYSTSGSTVWITRWITQSAILLEALRGEKVEQVKKLFEIVLQRGSSQEQLIVDSVAIQNSEKLSIDLLIIIH